MDMSKLMEFRTAYLRAIARAWADDAFRKALIHDPTTAMATYLQFQWPWGHVCNLEIKHDAENFKWIGNDWVWSRDLIESLTLSLPLEPPPVAPQTQAMVLADFYRQHVSLFSDDWGMEDDPKELGGPLGTEFTPKIGTGSGSPIGGFVLRGEEFAAFKVALLVAMAKAWQDAAFRETLKIDAAVALQAIRGYKMPWEMTITIKEDTAAPAQWQLGAPRNEGDPPQWYWHPGQKHTLTLYLPSKPREVSCEPIALAMYNATGAAYPFTCTC